MPSQKKKITATFIEKADSAGDKKIAITSRKKRSVKTDAINLEKEVAAKSVSSKNSPVKKTAPKKTTTKKATVSNKSSKAKSNDSGIHLLQLTPEGQKTNDPFFKAYPQSQNGLGFSELLDALLMAQKDPVLQNSKVWGLLTSDFTKRTDLKGQELLNIIESNPGFDLYYASAHPELEALYHNPWRSPEITHPEFIDISRRFLKAAGLSDIPVDSISSSALFATGHLMMATPAFWEKYVGFVETVFSRVQKNLGTTEKDKLFNEATSPGRMTYLALIVARLLNVFLMLKNSNFRAFKIPLPKQEKAMNTHLRFLRELKDLGLAQKSKWHLAAWVNYRGLYLAHVMGKAWIMKHIQQITPTDLHAAVPIAEVKNPYNTPLALANS